MRLREFAIPLQAFAALFLCGGIAWMILVMAGFNPNPPTALDIQLRSTQDVSFMSMNSTAAALAVQMVSNFGPTDIVLPPTQTDTSHPTATLAFEMIPISGPTLTASPTKTSLLSHLFPPTKSRDSKDVPTSTFPPTVTKPPTPIPTFTSIPTNTKTSTPIPTSTSRPTATNTPEPPPTATDVPPTATQPPPTATQAYP